MRVHHLNCGTLRPLGGRFVNGDRLPLLAARLVCHCLLIEADRGLVLVDSGFGLRDIDRLGRRSVLASLLGVGLGEGARRQLTRRGYAAFAIRPRLEPDETAVRQIAALGHSPADVSDIVLTHLDSDHAGGLAEFPAARVHVHQAEYSAAMSAATSSVRSIHRFRYWPYQWAHDPDWITYERGEGDRWFGLDRVVELRGLPDVALVPLPGHSRGHSGVAIRTGGGGPATGPARPWLLHAGDAYFDHREVDPVAPRSTRALASFQNWFQHDAVARRSSRTRLRGLVAAHGAEIGMFCSHDPVELARCRAPE